MKKGDLTVAAHSLLYCCSLIAEGETQGAPPSPHPVDATGQNRPFTVSVGQFRLPCVVPLKSLGIGGNQSEVAVCGVVVRVAAVAPVLLAGAYDTGTI